MRHVDTNSMGASAPRGIAINPACAVSFEETGAPLVVDRGQCPKPTNLWQSFLRGLYARSSLMRSTPFRIGMGFWLLFCVTIGFAGYSFYHSLQQQSLQRIDQGLDARHTVIENVYESDGINGVVEYLKASESGPMQEPVGFYLVNAQGESLFSNIGAIPGVTLDAETLAMPEEQTAGARASLDEAMDEAAHINSTFEALLRVAQIESGARRANFAHFNLAEVMELAHEVYEPVAEESGHTLINRLGAAESLPIEGDRELLLQLVINLVENAIHHCSDGVNIVLDGGVSDGRVWLSVADSGPGIPEESRLWLPASCSRAQRNTR